MTAIKTMGGPERIWGRPTWLLHLLDYAPSVISEPLAVAGSPLW